ncbi:MAG: hypothetical protein QF876_13420 [Desulfobacterales bacterium]|nr:hypothetical protein [Desulfobacterales bacterium]MDP6808631.1 hypothetical protein [Desulfobacterales bacterium]
MTDEDKVNLGKIQKQLQDDEALKKEVQTSDNTESNKRFVFDKKFDVFLQGLVDESLDCYKKLTEPNRYKYVKERFYKNYSEAVRVNPLR